MVQATFQVQVVGEPEASAWIEKRKTERFEEIVWAPEEEDGRIADMVSAADSSVLALYKPSVWLDKILRERVPRVDCGQTGDSTRRRTSRMNSPRKVGLMPQIVH